MSGPERWWGFECLCLPVCCVRRAAACGGGQLCGHNSEPASPAPQPPHTRTRSDPAAALPLCCRPPGDACLHRLHHGRTDLRPQPPCGPGRAPVRPPEHHHLCVAAAAAGRSRCSSLPPVLGCRWLWPSGGSPLQRAPCCWSRTLLAPRPRRHADHHPPSLPAAVSKAVVVPGQAIVPPCKIPDTVSFQGEPRMW